MSAIEVPSSDAEALGWLLRAWDAPVSALERYPLTQRVSIPHRRLVQALAQAEVTRRPLSSPDLASLIRGVLRHESADWVEISPSLLIPRHVADRLRLSDWESASITILEELATGVRVAARPWAPNWLRGAGPNALPEEALYEPRPRRQDPPEPGDPPLALLGLQTYQSRAQREAVRTVLSSPPGSTVIVNLPTGSGKSLCALLPALTGLGGAADRRGVTAIVVPTIALQLDLDARCREVIGHATAYRPEHEDAHDIALRCREGVQGPLFLSPESLMGSLSGPLREAARKNLVRAFVVDEAHMVTAWGDDFRPAFQQIAGMRRELLALSEQPFVTILMSATLTPYNLHALRELFGGPGPMHHVHAVRLRPEPSYWIQRAENEPQREAWILEAIRHLPRPLILYTTRPSDAEAWFRRLRVAGFTRCALVHGQMTERAVALDAWNSDEIDVMVATSAFGLGVDKRDVRAVIHATLPETIDRYYQEVGRGGRDGFGSLSLMIWTDRDQRTAHRLAVPTFIGASRGLERWESMFLAHSREVLGDDRYTLPLDVSPTHRLGDIDMDSDENRLWNLRTALLMARAGLIEFAARGTDLRAPIAAVSANRITVRVRDQGHLEPSTWAERVEPCRTALLEANRRAWRLMRSALEPDRCLSRALRDAYASKVDHVPVVSACGGCPSCRAHGLPNYCGRLVPRHSPPDAWPSDSIGPALERFLHGHQLGLVFYPHNLEQPSLSCALGDIARWLCEERVVNFVLSEALRVAWRELFARNSHWPVFLHRGLPSGITQRKATAVFLTDEVLSEWPNLWKALPKLRARTLILLPDTLTQPDRRDRLIKDILVGPPRFTLDQWQELFLE